MREAITPYSYKLGTNILSFKTQNTIPVTTTKDPHLGHSFDKITSNNNDKKHLPFSWDFTDLYLFLYSFN